LRTVLAEEERSSRADLVRKLGMSRARVSQVMGLLDFPPDVIEAVASLAKPDPEEQAVALRRAIADEGRRFRYDRE
jgi:hypothetical protein